MSADPNPSRCTHPLHADGTVCAYCGDVVTDAETLAHLDTLYRRRTRLWHQLSVAREHAADLEREYYAAVDACELARRNYQRHAAAPLIET